MGVAVGVVGVGVGVVRVGVVGEGVGVETCFSEGRNITYATIESSTINTTTPTITSVDALAACKLRKLLDIILHQLTFFTTFKSYCVICCRWKYVKQIFRGGSSISRSIHWS